MHTATALRACKVAEYFLKWFSLDFRWTQTGILLPSKAQGLLELVQLLHRLHGWLGNPRLACCWPKGSQCRSFLSVFHPWGPWHSCSLAIRKSSFYQTHPLLSWALLMAPSHRNAAVQIWDCAWLRARFGASLYLLLLYRESLTFSVLQLTLVKTQRKEASCSPQVFSDYTKYWMHFSHEAQTADGMAKSRRVF